MLLSVKPKAGPNKGVAPMSLKFNPIIRINFWFCCKTLAMVWMRQGSEKGRYGSFVWGIKAKNSKLGKMSLSGIGLGVPDVTIWLSALHANIKFETNLICSGAVFYYIKQFWGFCFGNRGSHDVMLFPSPRSTTDAVAAAWGRHGRTRAGSISITNPKFGRLP